jgi:DHA1 family vesicular acetylcholine transporter-like MFS transporter 3
MFFSTLVFACGTSYGVLFFARSLQVNIKRGHRLSFLKEISTHEEERIFLLIFQGVGSAFADTGGLAMIADR